MDVWLEFDRNLTEATRWDVYGKQAKIISNTINHSGGDDRLLGIGLHGFVIFIFRGN